MAAFEEEIFTLKEILVKTKDFKTVFNYYSENMADKQSFLELGENIQSPLIKNILQHIGERFFKEQVPLSHLLTVHMPKYNFFHGSCILNGRIACFLFFKDIDMGLLSLVNDMQRHETFLLRFSTMALEQDGDAPRFFHTPKTYSVN